MFRLAPIFFLLLPIIGAAQTGESGPEDSLIISSPAYPINFGIEKPDPPSPPPDPPEGILDSLAGTKPPAVLLDNKGHAVLLNLSFPDTTDLRMSSIRKLILSRQNTFFYCYSDVEKVYPNLQGFLRLELLITRQGRVDYIRAITDTFPSQQVSNCIRAKTKGLRFPGTDSREEPTKVIVALWLGPEKTSVKSLTK